jgi:hypothetical protein
MDPSLDINIENKSVQRKYRKRNEEGEREKRD